MAVGEANRFMVAAALSTHASTGYMVVMAVEAIPGWAAAVSGLVMVVASAVASLAGVGVALVAVANLAGAALVAVANLALVAGEVAAAGEDVAAGEDAVAGGAVATNVVTALTTSWEAPTRFKLAIPSSDDAIA